jgi:translation initiation factor 1
VPDVPPQSQSLKVLTEKRNKGKLVTSVRGFSCSPHQIQELLVQLKNSCGAGGSSDAQTLEIQGDHKARVVEILRKAGYRV